MQEHLDRIDARLEEIERRLSALEGSARVAVAADEPDLAPMIKAGSLSNISTLIGRILLVFGGAYFLRAITESEYVPLGLGIVLGMAYALIWLYVAYRKGGRKQERTMALLFGGTSVLLMLPLLVEAATRFSLLTGLQGTLALGFFCTLALLVAARHDLRTLGWLAIAGGIVGAFALLASARSAIEASILLLYLGLASLWVVYLRQWKGIQWLGALGAVAGITVLAVLGVSDNWPVQSIIAFELAVVMLVTYLVSFAIATHRMERNVGIFEAAHGVLTASAVLVTASIATNADQLALTDVGIPALILGILTYGLALTRGTRAARGLNFNFYSILGLGLVVAGTAFALQPVVTTAAWSALAVVTAWASGRFGRVALSLQCTFLLLVAGAFSGLFATGSHAFTGEIAMAWPEFSASHIVVAAATVACLFIPVAHYSERWGVMAGAPQLIVLALSVWEVGGLMVVYSSPLLAGAGTESANPAIMATIRTAVLSAASVSLALSSRYRRWPEARWLVYPVLILVGIKLLVEDFPNGQPATLFIALGLLGGALLLVAKLLRREIGDGRKLQ
jgi:hypothetical protein